MFISPLPDGGAGWAMFFAMIGAGAWVISAVIVEAFVFSMMLRVKIGVAAGLSIAVNAVTTVIGYLYANFRYEFLSEYIYGYNASFPTNFWLTIIALFVGSILVEGLLLIVFQPKTSRFIIWVTAIGANSVSYIVGIVIMVSFLGQPIR